jgi:hypothetical protein
LRLTRITPKTATCKSGGFFVSPVLDKIKTTPVLKRKSAFAFNHHVVNKLQFQSTLPLPEEIAIELGT